MERISLNTGLALMFFASMLCHDMACHDSETAYWKAFRALIESVKND